MRRSITLGLASGACAFASRPACAMLRMMTSFSRYLAGQHVQVWTELLGVGSDVRKDDKLLAEAEAVARETMSRVKRNLERLGGGLPELGYRLQTPTPSWW